MSDFNGTDAANERLVEEAIKHEWQHLDLSHRKMSCLPPNIVEAHSLRHLDISFNHLEDLTPLTGLKNLTNLSLYCLKSLEDISPLAKLTSLQQASSGNQGDTAFEQKTLNPLSRE